MINQHYKVKIGFGNNKGDTIKVVLQQEQIKIERLNRKKCTYSDPKVVFKHVQQISLYPFTQMIYQKRDPTVITELMKIQQNKQINKILQKSKRDTASLQNDLHLIANFAQNLQIDQFMSASGCKTQQQSKKYLTKYKNFNEAVNKFKTNEKAVEELMNMNKCNRQTAIQYLEPNDYNIQLFK